MTKPDSPDGRAASWPVPDPAAPQTPREVLEEMAQGLADRDALHEHFRDIPELCPHCIASRALARARELEGGGEAALPTGAEELSPGIYVMRDVRSAFADIPSLAPTAGMAAGGREHPCDLCGAPIGERGCSRLVCRNPSRVPAPASLPPVT